MQKHTSLHEGHRARLKKRFLSDGGENMADHELLEMLLFFAIPRRNTNNIAHALLNRYGTLEQLLMASTEDLTQITGIGESSALFLKTVSAMIRRVATQMKSELPRYFTAKDLEEHLLPLFSQLAHERLYMLGFDGKMRYLFCEKITDGSTSAVAVNVQNMLRIALSREATTVVLAHNHPRGLAIPSAADVAITLEYRDILRSVGIVLMEHYVVAEGECVPIIKAAKRDEVEN